MQFDGSTILLTGASSGIGEALARCFARDGHRLVLVARGEERLRALAGALHAEHGTRVGVLPTDLARPGAAAALASALRRKRRRIDVLVNNAGVAEQGAFSAISAERHQQLIDLNISALTAMLAAF
ncbi:MAG: SDR family NAD(P)-dependent oxidoreductase, partial [Acidimicrobiia bacterium]